MSHKWHLLRLSKQLRYRLRAGVDGQRRLSKFDDGNLTARLDVDRSTKGRER